MYEIYENLNFKFTFENTYFTITRISHEQFLFPVPAHKHGNQIWELHYVAAGNGILQINGVSHELSPDTLYVVGPHVSHEQYPFPSSPLVEYGILYNIREQNIPTLDVFNDNTFFIHYNMGAFIKLFTEIFKEYNLKRIGYIGQIQSLLIQLTIKAIRCPTFSPKFTTDSFACPTADEKKALICDKAFLYEYKDLTLKKLSNSLNLSSRQTIRFIKNHYNKTFTQKLYEARMAAATTFFTRPGLTSSDIAEKVGYTSVESFLRAYRKYKFL